MTLRQFFFRFLFGLFAVLALIALFNRIVDPFWYYRDIEIKGFNAVKTQFEHYERHVKPALLAREMPEAIILGSSFSEIGFDPTNPLFTNQGKLKSMNFALAGAPWGMVQCEFEFAVIHAPIKRALVGFTPGNLPLADCAKDYSSIGQVSTAELLLSNTALQASIDTVTQQDRQPSHTREGMYYLPSLHNAAADHGFREIFSQFIKSYHAQGKRSCPTATRVASTACSLDASPLDLSGLKRMIDTAQQHGVELVLYAYPSHAYLLELENQCGDQDTKWQAMKQIAEVVDAGSQQGINVRAYQFYGYNDVTAEPVEGKPLRYWHDPGHFTYETGNYMLQDMFGQTTSKLGRPLNTKNLDREYHEFLQGRTNFLMHNPKFMHDFSKLLPTKAS